MIPSLMMAATGGFLPGEPLIGALPPSQDLTRAWTGPQLSAENAATLERLERGDFDGDPSKALADLISIQSDLTRNINSQTANLPIRENLEAEVIRLVPTDTPMRNRIRRVVGSGTAVKWRQLSSFGGGWGTAGVQLGGGSNAQLFFSETGAPAEVTSTYVAKTASYKLLGYMGSVTGFGMAAGANFQNQYAVEKTNSIVNLMLAEENAILNGDSTSTVGPWGDGTNALSFDGLINLVTTANGVPSAQVQTSVGALTTAHIDGQLKRIYENGGKNLWMLMATQEALSLVHLMEASGSLLRVMSQGPQNKVNVGVYVGGYVHPLSGEIVDVIVDRFMPAGTIIFGADSGPTGQATLEMDVLPQVQLPVLGVNQDIQGYVAQEISPSRAAPQVFPWLVSVYEVLKMKSAYMFCKSTGVTAV